MKHTRQITLIFLSLSFILGQEVSGQEKASLCDKSIYLDEDMWKEAVGSNQLKNAAYLFVENDKALPNVLLIGNSISIGYTPFVRQELAGVANVYRIPQNGGDTQRFLDNYGKWLSSVDWDIIHINIGLHDLKRMNAEGNLDINFERNISSETYRANLQKVFQILTDQTDAKIIWATTTYVPEGSNGRITGDEVIYNQISIEVVKEFPEIAVDDLYSASLDIKSLQREANVHYTEEGYQKLGEVVAGYINEQLKVLKR